jgi:hypothetical protein
LTTYPASHGRQPNRIAEPGRVTRPATAPYSTSWPSCATCVRLVAFSTLKISVM